MKNNIIILIFVASVISVVVASIAFLIGGFLPNSKIISFSVLIFSISVSLMIIDYIFFVHLNFSHSSLVKRIMVWVTVFLTPSFTYKVFGGVMEAEIDEGERVYNFSWGGGDNQIVIIALALLWVAALYKGIDFIIKVEGR
jgi:hypothetical protein